MTSLTEDIQIAPNTCTKERIHEWQRRHELHSLAIFDTLDLSDDDDDEEEEEEKRDFDFSSNNTKMELDEYIQHRGSAPPTIAKDINQVELLIVEFPKLNDEPKSDLATIVKSSYRSVTNVISRMRVDHNVTPKRVVLSSKAA